MEVDTTSIKILTHGEEKTKKRLIVNKILTKEFWVDSNYLIYSDGRIFSKKSNIFLSLKSLSNGYPYITIHEIHYRINILVAISFVLNPDPINKTVVNHIDKNRENNHYTNLEWMTPSENMQHSFDTGRNTGNLRAILQFDKNGKLILEYPSIAETSRQTNIGEGIIARRCTEPDRYDLVKDKYGRECSFRYKEEKNKEEKPEGKSLLAFPNYIITELGKIYSLYYKRFLSLTPDGDGYQTIDLSEKGKKKLFRVNVLVATCYLPMPKDLINPVVGHKNNKRDDNRVENLQWMSQSDNVKQAYKTGGKQHIKKSVLMIDPKTNQVLKEFDSQSEASRQTGVDNRRISEACRGKRELAGDYIWRFKNSS